MLSVVEDDTYIHVSGWRGDRVTCPIVSQMPAVSAQYLELEEGNCIIGAPTYRQAVAEL